MVQNLTVSGTISNSSSFTDGMFGNDDLHTMIDGTAADSNEGDFISAQGTSGLLVALTDGAGPTMLRAYGTHKIYFDSKQNVGAGTPASIKIRLLQGTTEIVPFQNCGTTSAGAFGTYTLSAAQADDITDYSDLRFEIGATTAGMGGGDGTLFCVYLEVPDPFSPFLAFVE